MALKSPRIAYKVFQEPPLKILAICLSNFQLEKPGCQLNTTKLYCFTKKKKIISERRRKNEGDMSELVS